MEMKINRGVLLRALALLLCFYIAISPFFQPKRAKANPAAGIALIGVGALVGMVASRWVHEARMTPEELNQVNDEITANLQAAFPDPVEYNKQLGILENLSNDLLAGKDVDWSKYSGKAIYAISKAVIDVLYPTENLPDQITGDVWCYLPDGTYVTYLYQQQPVNLRPKNPVLYYETATEISYHIGQIKDYVGSNTNLIWNFYHIGGANESISFYGYTYPDDYVQFAPGRRSKTDSRTMFFANLFGGSMNSRYVPNITTKTVNKIKLPIRLPPSVINNYNTYINGESENLVIDPTDDELPQLPEDYNPVTDDPPDLDGFQDVTPDQEPTDTPAPTPTPTPTPSTPEYDGSSWIKPIGDFFAGLLSFLKDALIPTQTVDFSPLQNMSTDFANKFPFSLPGDIGKLFGVLQAEPRRPEFQMTFDLSKVGIPGDPIVWNLKFEQWDGAAAIVKTALYIGFLISLVFISKNFMKN